MALFDCSGPRIFGIAPGADVPKAFVEGLVKRTRDPQVLARTTIYANSERMQRRLRQMFQAQGSGLLPRLRLVNDLPYHGMLDRPQPNSTLDIELRVMRLVQMLVETDQAFAPKHTIFALSQALVRLFEEMQQEGVTREDIAALNAPDQSGYWEQALAFVNLARTFVGEDAKMRLPAGLARTAAQAALADWQRDPPKDPVLVVGSTGSRGTTALLMQAVAHLPQGALILPGFDPFVPQDVWDRLAALPEDGSASRTEDHPQYRFARLCDMAGVNPTQVKSWSTAPVPDAARNALVSLALRPAPITHAWLTDGPKLRGVGQALNNVTWVEAPDSRAEAVAIALRLRQAAELGQDTALITPDRTLARRVSAQMARWGILPDDSAGVPLSLTPEGRLALHVLDWLLEQRGCDRLITLLKHPLVYRHGERGQHLNNTRDLELYIRRQGKTSLTQDDLTRAVPSETQEDWRAWVANTVLNAAPIGTAPLAAHAARHFELTTTLGGGADLFATDLSTEPGGASVIKVFQGLNDTSEAEQPFTPHDYAAVVRGLIAAESVRRVETAHPHILIWGTLEARVQGADLVILAGLNEGTWPEATKPDPWLNRPLRVQAGLPLPERQVGLSAHDFQHSIGAPHVWVTRSARVDGTETVPSRWLNRIENLIAGLTEAGGPSALAAAKDRGAQWIAKARAWEATPPAPKTKRPSVVPPSPARIRHLSVTDVQTLIRDPYALYAKRVLGLASLDGFQQVPSAGLRGQIVHDGLAEFMRTPFTDRADPLADLHGMMRIRFETEVDHLPSALAWMGRLTPALEWFVTQERKRQHNAPSILIEEDGRLTFGDLGVTLTVRADRLDLCPDGQVEIYDYKTGAVSSPKMQEHFDKQLLLEAMMVRMGAFENLGPALVRLAEFLAVGPDPKSVTAPLDAEDTQQMFLALMTRYLDGHPMTARRALLRQSDRSRFDHLSRYGEWTTSDAPHKVMLT